LLDEAMSEMLKGTEKPFMDTYSMEMMALRMGALPKAESLIEVIGRIGFAAGMLLPDLTKHRNLARTSEKYAELLIAEGKEKEVVPVLEAWYPLSRTGFEQGGTLIEALVSFAIARLGSNSVPLLVAIGEDERADRMKRLSEAANGVYDVWKARMKSDDNDMDDIVMRHGSILHAMLLPSIGSEGVTKEDMAPGREIEQTWMEKGWLSAFISLLMLIMLGFFAISIFMRFSRGGESAPLLLLPDAGQMLRVILFSVVIPLAVFFVYARHTDLSGRDLSIRYWPRFVTELHLLSVVMLSVAAYQMQKLVDSRCRYLGLETPGARKWWQIFLLTLIPVGLIVWLASGCRKTALFRGTVARSLIPILAIVIILVGSMAHPHLVKRERTLVQADSILSIPDEGGFTRIENEVAKQLTREALAAMDAAEQELE
jgi:hypothetical protein